MQQVLLPVHLIAAELRVPLPVHLGLTAAESAFFTYTPPPCLVTEYDQVMVVDSIDRLNMLHGWLFEAPRQLPPFFPHHPLAPQPIQLPCERVVGFDVENIVDGFYRFVSTTTRIGQSCA